jgi:hypothetical protein
VCAVLVDQPASERVNCTTFRTRHIDETHPKKAMFTVRAPTAKAVLFAGFVQQLEPVPIGDAT